MILTPIRPEREKELSDYLRGLSATGSPLVSVSATHFARWVIVGDFQQGKGQLKPDTLQCRYLLFTSNLDGQVDDYLNDVVQFMAEPAAAIWSCCIGCPNPASGAALKAYLTHNMIDTGFFYSAYPEATVADVKRSLDVRNRLVQLILATQGRPNEEIRSRFLAEFSP